MNAWPEIQNTERSALVAETLRLSGRLRLRVYGESMLPALWPGEVAEIRACRLADVQSGDIVLSARGGRLFLHRFIARCPAGGFVLRGDSMTGPDPVFPPEAFLGRLISTVPRNRISRALSRVWFRSWGLVFCYCGIARRTALRWHFRGNEPSPRPQLIEASE